jgi:hypothetical protein
MQPADSSQTVESFAPQARIDGGFGGRAKSAFHTGTANPGQAVVPESKVFRKVELSPLDEPARRRYKHTYT